MSYLMTYLAGVFSLPIFLAAAGLGAWAFRRNGPTWTCDTCAADRQMIPGKRLNITVWASGVRHEIFTARRAWHRKAWAADEWNPANL